MVCAVTAIAACTGRTSTGVDGGAALDADVLDAPTDRATEAMACVDLVVMTGDLACSTDQDCMLSPSGHVCPGQCLACGHTIVNAAAAARFASQTASFPMTGVCGPCEISPGAYCNAGTCAVRVARTADRVRRRARVDRGLIGAGVGRRKATGGVAARWRCEPRRTAEARRDRAGALALRAEDGNETAGGLVEVVRAAVGRFALDANPPRRRGGVQAKPVASSGTA